MYRQYEDPRALENELVELKAHAQALLFKARQEGELSSKWDELSDLGREIAELEDRINFAWQDEEYNDWLDERAEYEDLYPSRPIEL